MAEEAVSLACERLLPLLSEVTNVIRGVPRGVADIKDNLESIQSVINDADRMAPAEQDNKSGGIKARVRKLREVAFRIADVIDEYIVNKEKQLRDPGCVAFLCDKVDFIKTLILHCQLGYEIRDIKSRLDEINERRGGSDSQIQSSFEPGSSSSSRRLGMDYGNLGGDEKVEVVGFEKPIKELIGWLEEERAQRTIISVVGTGGQGKTTLAKTVLDKVIGKFECHARIRVSKSYTVEGLLRGILNMFCKGRDEDPPQGISQMDRNSLIRQVKNYLQQKRYVIMFDDVWDKNFWSYIRSAVIDNEKRSRIVITTRIKEVAELCKESSWVYFHELQRFPPDKSWDLFAKKAFQHEPDGRCPEGLKKISCEIVEKCEGLPLSLLAIGGLLACKDKNLSEWRRIRQTLISELEQNPNSLGITKILGLSYDDLPYHLKQCFLYFGIYPEGYEVEFTRLIMQWTAEGFVKYVRGRTLEEVAEQYLKELITRSLVQVSSFSIANKAKRCRVHDLLREMILNEIEDSGFCLLNSEAYQPVYIGMIRRLKIATHSNNLMETVDSSHILSLYICSREELPECHMRIIPKRYKLLKVLDFEDAPLSSVPRNLGNLIHLRYLSFRDTNLENLPNSIGSL